MEKVVNPSSIIGCQRIQNVWRLYINKEDAKIKLLQQGIGMYGQHIQLFLQNPAAINQLNRYIQPTKMLIKVIKLCDKGANLTSAVKTSLVRDKIWYAYQIY